MYYCVIDRIIDVTIPRPYYSCSFYSIQSRFNSIQFNSITPIQFITAYHSYASEQDCCYIGMAMAENKRDVSIGVNTKVDN